MIELDWNENRYFALAYQPCTQRNCFLMISYLIKVHEVIKYFL